MVQLHSRIQNTTVSTSRIVLNNCVIEDYATRTDVGMRRNICCLMDYIGKREANGSSFLIDSLTQFVITDCHEEQLILRIERCHITRLANHGYSINNGCIAVIKESAVIDSNCMLQHDPTESTCSYE